MKPNQFFKPVGRSWDSARLISVLLPLMTVLTIRAGASEAPLILPVSSPAYGKSYGEWLNELFKWVFTAPSGQDPASDLSGEFARQRQSGDVWFFLSPYPGLTADRAVVVPSNKALFILITGLVVASYGTNDPSWDQPFEDPETGLEYSTRTDWWLQKLRTMVERVKDLACEIDGLSVPNLRSYLALSPAIFRMDVPDGSIIAPGPCAGVAAGYCVMLDHLPIGVHTIHALGTVPDQGNSEVTYHLTVVPPPVVSIRRIGLQVQLTFTGHLQSAEQIAGPWSEMLGTSPLTLNSAGRACFYRATE